MRPHRRVAAGPSAPLFYNDSPVGVRSSSGRSLVLGCASSLRLPPSLVMGAKLCHGCSLVPWRTCWHAQACWCVQACLQGNQPPDWHSGAWPAGSNNFTLFALRGTMVLLPPITQVLAVLVRRPPRLCPRLCAEAIGGPLSHPWATLGPPVGHAWATHGPPMGHPWATHGPPLGNP